MPQQHFNQTRGCRPKYKLLLELGALRGLWDAYGAWLNKYKSNCHGPATSMTWVEILQFIIHKLGSSINHNQNSITFHFMMYSLTVFLCNAFKTDDED